MHAPAGRSVVLAAVAASLLCAGLAAGAVGRASGPGVSLRLPMGWVSRQLPGGGIAAAAAVSDLSSAVPAGARLTVERVPLAAPQLQALIAGLDRSRFVGKLSAYPTTVAGKRASYVQWTAAEPAGNETARTIFVPLVGGSAETFTLVAPAANWPASNPVFDGILASVKFG